MRQRFGVRVLRHCLSSESLRRGKEKRWITNDFVHNGAEIVLGFQPGPRDAYQVRRCEAPQNLNGAKSVNVFFFRGIRNNVVLAVGPALRETRLG